VARRPIQTSAEKHAENTRHKRVDEGATQAQAGNLPTAKPDRSSACATQVCSQITAPTLFPPQKVQSPGAQHSSSTQSALRRCQSMTESLRLEKTSKIITSNHQPNTTTPAKPCPETITSGSSCVNPRAKKDYGVAAVLQSYQH